MRFVRSALRALRLAAAMWAVVAMAAPAVIAHHGRTVKFDPGQPIRLEGRVAQVDWSNPHAHIVMLVQQGETVLPWYVELESIVALERSGWQRDTLRPGDAITVEGLTARDGSRQVSGDSVVATGTGQRVLHLSAAAVPPVDDQGRATRAAPRWPNGEPRLGPEPGSSGYWAPVDAAMVERGADVAVHANGQLEDLDAIERVAPFQPWARSLYEYRQRRFLRDDPLFLQCRPPGGPRKFQVPYGIQFIEERPHQRIFVAAGGGNRDWHLIYTDGRALDGGFGHDDGNFLYYGRNVGAWDGDSFVIRSTGFNESFWFANGGLPHTSLLSLTERLTRTDHDTLIYEVTINDPGAYTRAWTSTWRLRWVAGAEPPEYYCQDNRP